jgi:mRNA interferase MazF
MVSWVPWTPGRGDVVWVRMSGFRGELSADGAMAPRRPALVLSPAAYSARTGQALVCPVVAEAKGYPFEVELPRGLPASGVVLADRVTCVEWRSCGVRLACAVPEEVASAVEQRLLPLLTGRRGER